MFGAGGIFISLPLFNETSCCRNAVSWMQRSETAFHQKKGVIMLCEPVWMHDGVDKREWFEKGLEPDILADDLKRYKMLCSKDFNMTIIGLI